MSESELCKPKADKASVTIGFKQGAGSKAGSIGASIETAPTIAAASSGTNRTPAVMVDVYNQTMSGQVASSVTAAVGGANTSGPKVMAVDCRNSTENPDVNGTLQAKDGGVLPSI